MYNKAANELTKSSDRTQVKSDDWCILNGISKPVLDEAFVISRIIKVEVRVISRSRGLRLITLTEALDITKTHLIILYYTMEENNGSHTPNANMADHSVVARDELHESEVSEASMICFENAFSGNSCLVLDLFSFISLCVRVAVFLNATRRD